MPLNISITGILIKKNHIIADERYIAFQKHRSLQKQQCVYKTNQYLQYAGECFCDFGRQIINKKDTVNKHCQCINYIF